MPKGYGIFLWLVCFFIWFLLIQTDYKGYAHTFSDWSNPVKCDFVTNLPVYKYYSGIEAKWFRVGKIDTLPNEFVVGVDYYALYPMSGNLLPKDLMIQISDELKNGRVYYFKIKDNMIYRKDR
jgi:hypothetical protein